MLENQEKYSHEIVRKKLEKIQVYGGAAIKPLGLYDAFYKIIQQFSPSRMNRSKVRDIVDTYCALCNEFFIIYHFDENPRNDFYMSDERWAKYYLGQRAKENSIKFLEKFGAITTKLAKNPLRPINTVRMYTIDTDFLNILLQFAEEEYEKKKQKRRNSRTNSCVNRFE